MIRAAGRDPGRGVCVEVGTGWRPFLPFVLSLLGAERVLTYDVNRWLNARYAFETFRALESRLDVVTEKAGVSPALLRDRYGAAAAQVHDLDSLLAAFRVEYRFPGDARRTGLADGSVDYVVSSNVLEHIPPETLREIHRETSRILKPDGLAVHRFNPADHWSHADRSVVSVNFLRFSPREWHWYGGSGLAYHNRLRCVQHLRLFEEAGLRVLSHRERLDARALEALQLGRIPLHPDFAGFSPEELAADYMWVVCGRPE
jgi:SAM-dependent methyltransferase